MHLQRCKTRVDERKETCRLLHVEYVASVGLFARRAMHHQPQRPCPLVLLQLVRDLTHSHRRAPARHPVIILYPSCCHLRDQEFGNQKAWPAAKTSNFTSFLQYVLVHRTATADPGVSCFFAGCLGGEKKRKKKTGPSFFWFLSDRASAKRRLLSSPFFFLREDRRSYLISRYIS